MWKKKKQDNIFNDFETENNDEHNNDFHEIPLKQHDTVTDYIIYYISGYIIKKLK